MLLLSLSVLAAPRIVSVGTPVTLDGPGNWPRLFPRADSGWWFVTANQSGLYRTELDATLARGGGASDYLLEDDTLIDHGWATCPDGTLLHVGMGTRTTEQRTAVLRRYDRDFTLRSVSTAIDDDPDAVIVDQPAVCGPTFQGFGYSTTGVNPEDGYTTYFSRLFLVNEDNAFVANPIFSDRFNIVGASMLERDGLLHLVAGNVPPDGALRTLSIDASGAAIADRQVGVSVGETRIYWPQATVDIDGHAFTVFIQQDEREGWNGQFGEVYVVQFDENWEVVDKVEVLGGGPTDGGFQPGLAYREGQLVVSYNTSDRGNEAVIIEIAADPDSDTGRYDTGTPDTGTRDTGMPDTGAPDTAPGDDTPIVGVDPTWRCGCAHGRPTDLSFGLAVLALAWTRGRVRRATSRTTPASRAAGSARRSAG